MTLQFMKNLHNQTGRSFRDVVCDMGIIIHMVSVRNGHERDVAHKLVAIAGQMIWSNVFLPTDNYLSFPYPFPIKEVSFLFDMKCHLIYRAFMDLYDIRGLIDTHLCMTCTTLLYGSPDLVCPTLYLNGKFTPNTNWTICFSC